VTIDEEAVSRMTDFILEDTSSDEIKAKALEPRTRAKQAMKSAKVEEPAVQMHDIKNMSPQELQEVALQNLVNEVGKGSVPASKELLSFTENVYVSSNQDLEGMTSEELLNELDVLRSELQHIVNKEAVGI